MAVNMPDIFKIKVQGVSKSCARTELVARKHTIHVDEPVARNGTDLAATPLETLLSSFLACTNVIAHDVASEMGIEIRSIEFSLIGHLDTRGFRNVTDVPIPFPIMDLSVQIDTGAADHEIEQLKLSVAKRCPVSALIRSSGTEITEVWSRFENT